MDYPDTPPVDIDDKEVPKGPAPVTITEEYVPKISIVDGHKLPQTGQNFWLVELLLMLGTVTIFMGIIVIIRTRKKEKKVSETK